MNSFKFKLLLLMAVLPLSAHAYIDPSSSLLIIQGVLAFVGAVLVLIKHPIQTIKRWIKKIKNKTDA